MIKRSDILVIVIATMILLFSIDQFNRTKTDLVFIDLDSITARGRLIAVTDFNSTNYFIYRGEPMGFNFELLKAFSDYLNIDLEIVTENQPEKALNMLRKGEADILAMGITKNTPGKRRLRFTEPLYETRQVLVQRKPVPGQAVQDSSEKVLTKDLAGLAGKKIYVQEGSSRIWHLRSVLKGKKIRLNEVPFDSEKLIQMVAGGEIDFAICDENVSGVNATYYPEIDVTTPISESRGISWGIRRTHSASLLEELNHWIIKYRKTSSYKHIYAKYFKNSRSSTIVRSDYYALNTGRISPWDEFIKIYSDSIGWDWRLLASLICQESRFVSDVRSWAGAYGLMQVMPATGRNFGIDITASPVNNIRAGTLYIEKLQQLFDTRVPDEEERYRFILAAYNAGPGHILDAMKLAEKNGKDPALWEGNVADWLLKKSDPLYYKDTLVKNGYFRGKESVAFVNEILARYEHYKNIITSGQN